MTRFLWAGTGMRSCGVTQEMVKVVVTVHVRKRAIHLRGVLHPWLKILGNIVHALSTPSYGESNSILTLF